VRRLPLVTLPALALAGFVFFVAVAVPWVLTNQPHTAAAQPVYFDHQIHTQVANLDCAFCHRTAATGVSAGYPDLQQCMFCHTTIGEGVPEIEKVRQAWTAQQPLDWARIHRLPDHTRFPHDAHVQAGVDCTTCHGNVQQMGQVQQMRPLNMSDCVDCHRQTGAPTQCGACHY
jgi:hypothetical protein